MALLLALLLTCYILDSVFFFFFNIGGLLGRCIRTKKVSFIRLAKASLVSCLLSESEDLSSDPESSESGATGGVCSPTTLQRGGRWSQEIPRKRVGQPACGVLSQLACMLCPLCPCSHTGTRMIHIYENSQSIKIPFVFNFFFVLFLFSEFDVCASRHSL